MAKKDKKRNAYIRIDMEIPGHISDQEAEKWIMEKARQITSGYEHRDGTGIKLGDVAIYLETKRAKSMAQIYKELNLS